MKTIIGKRVKRLVLIRKTTDDTIVIVKESRGRRWVEHVYRLPTTSSLKRVQRLIGYPSCALSNYEYDGKIVAEYFRYV